MNRITIRLSLLLVLFAFTSRSVIAAYSAIAIPQVTQEGYLNSLSAPSLGWSASVSGNTAAVLALGSGEPGTNNVLIYVREAGVWNLQAELKSVPGFGLGSCVAISGDTVVVGSPSEDSNATGVDGDETNTSATNSGCAYVFVRNGQTWTRQAYLKASNTDTDDVFGWSVAVSGETIVVGAYGEDSASTGVNGGQGNSTTSVNLGAAYVFVRSGTTWSQQAYLKASNSGSQDMFGWSVAIADDTVVVGAYGERSNATGVNGNESNNSVPLAGAAYVFVRSGTTWSQQAYLKASNTGILDQFGYSVANSGNTIVVGANRESSAATGVNGIQSDHSAGNAGAAYVFVRSGASWSQQAYLKASNTNENDQFAETVSTSGDIIVVGAVFESSSATGVNGNQSDNSSGGAGAAYVFKRVGATWAQQAYLKASDTGSNDQFGFSVGVSGDTVLVATPGGGTTGAGYVFNLHNNPGTTVYGAGTAGCAGTHTLGVTHAPMINSPHFAITCDNAPPLSLGLGLVTDSQDLTGSDPFGLGVLLHSDFLLATEVLSFDFYSDSSGYAETVGTVISNSPALIGKTYYACALWAWPTSTCVLPGFNPYNLSTSKGLAITILVP